MATWEPDEIDFEDQYDKVDPIDDDSLDESINELNKSIQEQEELQEKLSRAEWTSMNKDERTKLEQQIVFNEKKQGEYVMRASKTIISILHRDFDKIKQDGKVMVLDQQSAEILSNKLRLVVTDEGTYKIAFENERGTDKDILSPGNRWLEPNAYLRIFGKKFMKDIGFDVLRRVKAWVIARFGRIFRFSGIVSKFCKTSELGVKNYVKPPLLHRFHVKK